MLLALDALPSSDSSGTGGGACGQHFRQYSSYLSWAGGSSSRMLMGWQHRTFDVLPDRAAGTQCTPCPKAFNADQLAFRNFDVLQTRAAGTQCTKCPRAVSADRLAFRTFDVLQIRQPALSAHHVRRPSTLTSLHFAPSM